MVITDLPEHFPYRHFPRMVSAQLDSVRLELLPLLVEGDTETLSDLVPCPMSSQLVRTGSRSE